VDIWIRKKILFWEDKWLGQCILKDKYPRVYANSCLKDVLVCMGLERKPIGMESQLKEKLI